MVLCFSLASSTSPSVHAAQHLICHLSAFGLEHLHPDSRLAASVSSMEEEAPSANERADAPHADGKAPTLPSRKLHRASSSDPSSGERRFNPSHDVVHGARNTWRISTQRIGRSQGTRGSAESKSKHPGATWHSVRLAEQALRSTSLSQMVFLNTSIDHAKCWPIRPCWRATPVSLSISPVFRCRIATFKIYSMLAIFD